MAFRTILCPTDFSPGSEAALGVSAELASQMGAALVVAHSWYVPPSMYAPEFVFPPYVEQQVVDDAQLSLDEAVRTVRARGVQNVSGLLLTGPAWAEIVSLLDRQRFDLCVIGTHGRTGVSRVMLGSVAEKVVRHAPCSVLAVHAGTKPKRFAHILVPTDFSASATHAADLAAELVPPEGQVTLLHVIEIPVPFGGDLPVVGFQKDIDKRASDAVEREAERLRKKTSARIAVRWRIGYPGVQTLEVIDDDSTVDLVVMGSEGRTGIKRALLGSVAEKIVRHAKPPVLVVRQRS